jgi:hypothetical protein
VCARRIRSARVLATVTEAAISFKLPATATAAARTLEGALAPPNWPIDDKFVLGDAAAELGMEVLPGFNSDDDRCQRRRSVLPNRRPS